jgi:hypothetical protein
VLRACRDENLLRLATHPSRCAEVIANRLPQLNDTARVGIAKMDWGERAEFAAADFPPRLDRASIDA